MSLKLFLILLLISAVSDDRVFAPVIDRSWRVLLDRRRLDVFAGRHPRPGAVVLNGWNIEWSLVSKEKKKKGKEGVVRRTGLHDDSELLGDLEDEVGVSEKLACNHDDLRGIGPRRQINGRKS